MSGDEGHVAEFYRGRSILVTGGTGFMGKVLVEKLLRSCPGLEKIFLLIRPKKGQDMNNRLHQLLSVPIFDWMREHHPERLGKVIPINGDLTLPVLGLSKEDQQCLQGEVSIVFHSAATVKFDEPLKLSVGMNLNGTLSLTQLCLNMPKLEALVHVSTAYCNCNIPEVQEEVYPPPADPSRVIQCVESLDEDILDSVTDRITRNHPNTYTFTKALAENVLLKQSAHLPIAIIRPSIVTASWKEPLPGWVDNLNGPTGMIVGAGKGVLRTLLCHKDKVADIIPVDVPINLAITVAWHMATSKSKKLQIYNCTSGTVNPIRWGKIQLLAQKYILEHPYSDVIWYPGGSFKNNRFINAFCILAFHLIPACMLDTIALVCGQKPIMLKIHKKVQKAVSSLEFFTTHEWRFASNNMIQLHSNLHPADKKLFNFDISTLKWTEYIESYVLGTRQFLLKEDPKSLESARRHLRKMFWIHHLCQFLLLVLGFWVLWCGKFSTLGHSVFNRMMNFIFSH